ncbi:SAM-dependent methyltransferase [soil metagenome]
MPAKLIIVDELRDFVANTVSKSNFRRATFGGKARQATPWLRAIIRPVTLRDATMIQIEYFDAKKSFTKNLTDNDLTSALNELHVAAFSDIHLEIATEAIDIRTSKKGKIFVSRSAITTTAAPAEHNRVKGVPLPEGESNRLLEAMGILGKDGRVRPAFRAKFTQINEFLKHFEHCLDDAGLRSLGRPVTILDCGCGASYLTLATHYYLNDKLGLPARILGVDVNDEVIRKSLDRASRLGSDGIDFSCERIDAHSQNVDVVIALHACDTATDAALAQAVKCQAKLILSVPCCHHDLNDKVTANGEAAVLRPILRHGILKQRQADLVTDAFRALLLRIHGYRTEVVEFVSPEHTARNLMIRAIRIANTDVAPFVSELQAMKQFWQVTPHLETLLQAPS